MQWVDVTGIGLRKQVFLSSYFYLSVTFSLCTCKKHYICFDWGKKKLSTLYSINKVLIVHTVPLLGVHGLLIMFYYTALQNVPKSSVDLNGPPQRLQVCNILIFTAANKL